MESQDFGDSFEPTTFDNSALFDLKSHAQPHEGEWQDDAASLSGSAHPSSGPDEDVFDNTSHHSSPRTSSGSGSDNEESWISQKQASSPYTPLKTRSPFRNPSSVRAMQTDITPPRMSSPLTQQRNKLHTPSRQGTPRSSHSHHGAIRTPSKLSPGKKLKKEYPLVLLHVTILPLPTHYSSEVLESSLPPTIVVNWKLLQEKTAQTVLERGILIPHPREDYDLLEERLLESLELKKPRILKCGHFHLSAEEEADVLDQDSDVESDVEDTDICEDCGRRIRDGRFGDAGTGSKRWDIKIFAANGLMRAGAWGAAWKEMERVDVEILPWMEESMKQELELRREEDDRLRMEHDQSAGEEGVAGLDDERLKEIYGHSPQHYEEKPTDERKVTGETPEGRRSRLPLQSEELSLWELLLKFLYISAQDRRNIAILFLSTVVLFLAMRPGTPPPALSNMPLQAPEPVMPSPVAQLAESAKEVLSKASASASSVATPQGMFESQSQEEDAETAETESSWTESNEQVVQEIFED